MPRFVSLAAGKATPTAARPALPHSRHSSAPPPEVQALLLKATHRNKGDNSQLSTLHSQLLPAAGKRAKRFRRSRERAKAANRQTPPMTGSGSEVEAEDRAQGGGGRPVRCRRAEARAWQGAVSRDEATRRGSAADGAGGRMLPPGGRDEGETGDPRAKTCHARAISPPPAERTASGRVRIRQDSPPTAYMHTPSGAMDAKAASPGAGVQLRRNRPHADKARKMHASKHANSRRGLEYLCAARNK